MTFLTLNGWEVPIADGNAAMMAEEIGAVGGRSFSGMQRDTRRALKRKGDFTTPPLSRNDGEALIHLLQGEGWHWSFDADLYSEDTLLGPALGGYSVTLGTTSPSPKFGVKRLKIPSSTGILLATTLSTSYTMMAWRYSGSVWEHWVRRCDAGATTLWKNGSSGQSSIAFLDMGSGLTWLRGLNAAGSPTDCYLDDLVVLPWAASDGQIAAWYAAGSAFSAIPKLDLAGDVLREGGSIEVRAKIGSAKFMQAMNGGSWSSTMRSVQFSLEEV